MVTIGMYYDVLPGKEDLFEKKFFEVLHAMEAMPGHQRSFLYRRVDDPTSYAILSEWDSQDGFMSFVRSEAFKQVTSWGREQVLRQAPRHKIYPRGDDLGGGRPH